ncbi:MAG: hypothetical protein K0R82_2169 [Flavipsychrobacter sp.]|jgi:hypothetical protein|nr:hypothetical protein [Flavipsychrobacter sp.]
MKKKKGSIIFVFVGVLMAVGASVGVVMWNKAPEKVESSKGIPITATQLCKEFDSDEAAANRKYLNKALEVTGTVSEVTKNQDGIPVVLVQGDDASMNVQCTMRERNVTLAVGKQVTVKGFCSGNTMFDVLLTDCIVK